MSITNLSSTKDIECAKAVTVVSEAKDLENNVKTLHEEITALESALLPVLRSQSAEDACQPKAILNGSPVRISLTEIDQFVRSAIGRLTNLLNRLDL
jgi:hypothetical protein